jgi:hypothetical protein
MLAEIVCWELAALGISSRIFTSLAVRQRYTVKALRKRELRRFDSTPSVRQIDAIQLRIDTRACWAPEKQQSKSGSRL